MHWKRYCLGVTLFLAVLCSRPTPSTALIEDVLDVLHVVKEVTTAVLKAWDIVKISTANSDIDFPLMRDKQKKVLSRLREVSNQIIKTEDQVKLREVDEQVDKSKAHFSREDKCM